MTAARCFRQPGCRWLGLSYQLARSWKAHASQGQGELTLFETRTTHELVTQTNAGGRATYQNAGRTLCRGLELGWSAAWAPAGRGCLNSTFLNAHYRASFLACKRNALHRARDWAVDAFARVDNLLDRRHVGSPIIIDGKGRYFELAPGRTWWAGVHSRRQF